MSDPRQSLALQECPHCEESVPMGAFCGNCGAHLVDTEGARRRLHSFAAAPHEHVAVPAVVTTLFPHLPRRHLHAFRNALTGGVLLVAGLSSLRLLAPATLVASLILPILFLLYLYEVEVYERAPVQVLLATFVTGAGLGTGYTLVSAHFIHTSLFRGGPGVGISGVLLPVIAQLLMVAPPLLLINRRQFDETLDGLTFGVATALGFTMAVVVVGEWKLITDTLRTGVPVDDALRLVRIGVLAAIVNACTTGTVTASLWLRRHGRSRQRHGDPSRGLALSTASAFAAQVGLGVASYYIANLVGLVALWAAAAAVLLVWLRIVIHYALLEEGRFAIGLPSACSECHRLVPTMLFCPACGAARAAAPKHSRTEALPTVPNAKA